MFKTLRNAWNIPDLRKRMLYTLVMIVIFRLGTFIPVPGLDASVLKGLVEGSENSLFGLLDAFSGGSFGNATIFAMSITPYINSSIILQLLTVAIPALERLAKEGEEGRKVIAKWTRYVTVILAFIQATGLYFGLRNAVENPGFLSYVTIVATFTAGTAFLMWLGEQITEKGIGNGISIIIFAGIVSGVPGMVNDMYQNFMNGSLNIWGMIGIVIFILAMIAFVVFINDAERRIPVQYAKRMVGRKMYGGQSTHIPIKVNMSGVLPVIFASSILSVPPTVQMFLSEEKVEKFASFFGVFTTSHWFYSVMYFVLILFFAYFYASIQYNPVEMANNIRKNSGMIPGLRPGKPTADYIKKILGRITLLGALLLSVVALFPNMITLFTNLIGSPLMLSLGGTSLIIVVGVALETVKQLESQMMMRHYKGFLD